MKRPKIGDIIEIPTRHGFAYAQFTHKHRMYGALLRVYNTIYQTKQSLDVIQSAVNSREPDFSTFFPLGAAVNRSIVSVVGNAPIPEKQKPFPLFRDGVVDQKTRKVETWWLWDGENEWPIGELASEQKRIPIRGVWNDTLLVERIETGWTPETDDHKP